MLNKNVLLNILRLLYNIFDKSIIPINYKIYLIILTHLKYKNLWPILTIYEIEMSK